MAFTNLDDFVNKTSDFSKTQHLHSFTSGCQGGGGAGTIATTAYKMYTDWIGNSTDGFGTYPGGTAETYSRTSNGSVLYNSPSAGKLTITHATGSVAQQAHIGNFILCDRLCAVSGLSGVLSTEQTFTLAPTRNTGGVGNVISLEIAALIGATATTVKAKYTNQDGVANRETPLVAIGGTGDQAQTRAWILPFFDGDTGVRSVESITLTGTTGTNGNIAVTIIRPLLIVPNNIMGAPANSMPLVDIPSDACLFRLWTSSLAINLGFRFANTFFAVTEN
ncbi:MAG: hypothetical protein IPL34_20410 [Thiofilum sp.]|uniref:hypothetical protein n=1 Tax=Thiofilum sp. TaxID=2212733 RepID=UPI0025D69CB8|nr:hypothetical protein [Thiofilum sp.]MBK8455646.1 hypothetical protein [Thiofilum sp.]